MACYIKQIYCNAWLIPYQDQNYGPIETIQKSNKVFVPISLIGKSQIDQNILDELKLSHCVAIEVGLIARRQENEDLIFILGRFKVIATCTNQQDVKENLVKKNIYQMSASIPGQFQNALSLIFHQIILKQPSVKEIFEFAKEHAIGPKEEAHAYIDHENTPMLIGAESSESDSGVAVEFFNLLKK